MGKRRYRREVWGCAVGGWGCGGLLIVEDMLLPKTASSGTCHLLLNLFSGG